jgi:hypothetical protein
MAATPLQRGNHGDGGKLTICNGVNNVRACTLFIEHGGTSPYKINVSHRPRPTLEFLQSAESVDLQMQGRTARRRVAERGACGSDESEALD